MTQWYYADRNRQQQGPVDAAELARLYHQGQVDGSTLVWRDGLAQWEALASHPGVLALDAPAAAPPAAGAALELQPIVPEPAAEAAAPADPVTAPASPAAAVATYPDGHSHTAADPAPSPWTIQDAGDAPVAAATSTAGSAADTSGAPSAPADWTVPATPAATDSWNTADASAAYSPYAAPAATPDNGSWVAAQPAGEVVLAGFWKRTAAYLIDSLIVGVAGGLIGMLLGLLLVPLTMAGDAGAAAAMVGYLLIQLVSLAITAAYYAGFHASRGQATLGKMAIGIKVVRPDGGRISLMRGVGRYFAFLLSGLILCIGFLMAAFTERKQGLHDMLCDTLVVDKWAFTEHPEWQRRELGTVAIVVLVLWALLLVALVGMLVAMVGSLAAMAG